MSNTIKLAARDNTVMRYKSMTSLAPLPTDVMGNQWLEETAYNAPGWEALLQDYSNELMALAAAVAVAVVFIVWFARHAWVMQQQAIRRAQSISDFLAVLSHEIRTPISVIFSAVELLQYAQLDHRQRELLTVTGSSAGALLALVDAVLDWSKLDAHRLELEQMPTDMAALVREVIGMVSIQAQEKGLPILLENRIPAHLALRIDPTRMRQIVLNLLSNAVKFTERGSIRVDLRLVSPSALQVAVQDTGIGIPAERQARLFQPFTQADASIARRYGGTGLGLTICRQLIALMNGTLVLQSAAGSGTLMRFTIPVTTQERS